ncbi:hypothetical protein AB0M45_03810 [Nocardia sp. NPDC051787]|uniref:hypothetical protein n=1 Tax=Nocardia sp. NPDC051787 TaxID=3155415 RepID=UPI00341C2E84
MSRRRFRMRGFGRIGAALLAAAIGTSALTACGNDSHAPASTAPVADAASFPRTTP